MQAKETLGTPETQETQDWCSDAMQETHDNNGHTDKEFKGNTGLNRQGIINRWNTVEQEKRWEEEKGRKWKTNMTHEERASK